MKHNHQSWSHPASKMVPKEELKYRLTPKQRKLTKKVHNRRSRQYLKSSLKETC